uniref:Uncharacterized protein n=1 Tax=Ralstonia solanacearum TaxID=305 RepID=A0A0S4UXU6_RALSL|nr:protein of unknown function [Ralstonia solanacearum]
MGVRPSSAMRAATEVGLAFITTSLVDRELHVRAGRAQSQVQPRSLLCVVWQVCGQWPKPGWS